MFLFWRQSMDMLDGIRSFVRVVEAGGFAAAARETGVSRSVVHKQVARLEDELGVQLLRRSTRKVAATDTGAAFYQRSVAVLAELDAALSSVSEMENSLRGTLRVNAPMSFGTLHMADIVAEFMGKHPDVRVELVLSDRFVDPLEEGFDVSIRISEPAASTSLVTRQYAPVRRVLCASPGYLRRHGEPSTPRELRSHRCLHYGYQASGVQWRLRGHSGGESIAIDCAMWSNNGETLACAALRDQGIALLPTFIVGANLQRGELLTLLCDYEPSPLTLCALYPRHRHLSSKVRLFVDAVGDAIGDRPYWDSIESQTHT
jgi:DNA-binding transcriptional LysR family regulator